MLAVVGKPSRDTHAVSVAGCLGYDVLDNNGTFVTVWSSFSCWLFRL